MRRVLACLVVLLMMSAMVFASGSEETAATQEFDPNMDYEVSIGCFGDFESITNAAMEVDSWPSNITLVQTVGDYGGHHNRLVTVFQAGEGANDLEYVDFGYMGQFVGVGYLTDLSAAYDADAIVGDIIGFAVDNGRRPSDGHLEGIPVDVAPAVIYYNVTSAAEMGVSPEEIESMQTWDDFYAICDRLTGDLDGDGETDRYAIPHPADVASVPLNGGKGNWFDADGNPFAPAEKYLDTLTMIQTIRNNGWDANYGQWSGEWTSGIVDGSFVMFPSGFWMLGHLMNWMAPDLAGQIRCASLPSEVPTASNGGSYITMPASSTTNTAAAWEVIEWLTTDYDAQISALVASGAFPALTTTYEDDIMDAGVEYLGGQPARRLACDLLVTIPANEITQYDSALLAIWNTAAANVVNDGMDVQAAYDQMVQDALAAIQ